MAVIVDTFHDVNNSAFAAEIRVINLINWIVWRAWFTRDDCKRRPPTGGKKLLIRERVAMVSAGSVEKMDARGGDGYRRLYVDAVVRWMLEVRGC